MKFWEKHGEEMRKARLLAASAILYGTKKFTWPVDAVHAAFDLEKFINEKITKESK